MGISLYGLTPATTYDALIKTGDNEPLTASLKVLSDGVGTNLPMEASTTGINFTGTLLQSGVAVPTAGQVAAKQDTLVSGTNIKTVNSTSLLGSGNVAVQDVLVSGTNIKTINSTSLLGSGNIAVVTTPSGVAGAIQFSDGSAFASDATNLFWDDTNNRLGVGTNAPTAKVFIQGTEVQTSGTHLTIQGTGTGGFSFADSYATTYYSMYPSGVLAANRTYANYIINSSASGNDTAFNSTSALNLQIGGVNKLGASSNGINIIDRLTVNSSNVDTSARAVIKGSGSTSATTSLLVQNSSALEALKITDDGTSVFKSASGTLMTLNANGDIYTGIGNNAQIQVLNSSSVISARSPSFWFRNDGGPTGQYYANFTGGQFAIGKSTTQAVASALIEMSSTTMGFLPPRMTTTQKNAIASPAAGLQVYDTTTNKLCCYNGSTWNDLF